MILRTNSPNNRSPVCFLLFVFIGIRCRDRASVYILGAEAVGWAYRNLPEAEIVLVVTAESKTVVVTADSQIVGVTADLHIVVVLIVAEDMVVWNTVVEDIVKEEIADRGSIPQEHCIHDAELEGWQ